MRHRLRGRIQQPRPRARAPGDLRTLDARGRGLSRRSHEGAARRARAELRPVAAPVHRSVLASTRTHDAPLALFIHGGYWRSLDPSMFSHMARGLNAHGVTVAVAGYDLAPQVSIAQIIEQMRHAVPVPVAAHSASASWSTAIPPADISPPHGRDRLARARSQRAGAIWCPPATAISGVFDLDAARAHRP